MRSIGMHKRPLFRRASGLVFVATAVALLMAMGPRGATVVDSDGVRIVDPDHRIFGRTYSELAGEWWNWAFQGPIETFPLFDETGEFCDVGQNGKFWFLAGNFGGTSVRSCTVPAGKALFFPVVNTLWWAPEDGDTAEELRAIANSFIDPGALTISCEINGESVADLFAYRAQSPPGGFTFDIPEGSVGTAFGFDAGPRTPAVADGYWIALKPLPEGAHAIHFSAIVGDPDTPDFELDVTYLLTVSDDDDDN
jgi:hypothetical protein